VRNRCTEKQISWSILCHVWDSITAVIVVDQLPGSDARIRDRSATGCTHDMAQHAFRLTKSDTTSQTAIPARSIIFCAILVHCIFSQSFLAICKYSVWKGKRYSYPCSSPWMPRGLWDVEAPTFSRQSVQRWRWSQPYTSAALYTPGRFLVLIFVIDWVDLRATVQLEGLC
jgi:hypothetical protein